MKKCISCGQEIPADAQVCPLCHASLAAASPAGLPVVSGKATASLVLGIVSLLLSIPAGLAAIILGHIAKSDIRKSQGRLTGDGKALAGLILGYLNVCLGILALLLLPNLMHAGMAANEIFAMESLRTMNTACVTYAANYGGFPPALSNLGPGNPETATAANLIDAALAGGSKGGYTFDYEKGPTDAKGNISSYAIHAEPVKRGTTGRRSFFTDDSGVIRANPGSPASQNSPSIE